MLSYLQEHADVESGEYLREFELPDDIINEVQQAGTARRQEDANRQTEQRFGEVSGRPLKRVSVVELQPPPWEPIADEPEPLVRETRNPEERSLVAVYVAEDGTSLRLRAGDGVGREGLRALIELEGGLVAGQPPPAERLPARRHAGDTPA